MGRGGQNEADYADDFSEDDFTEDEADMAEGQNNGEITPSRSTTGEVQWAHATTAAVEGSSSPGGAVAGLGMGLPGLRGKKPAPAIKEWTGLSSFPAATQTALHSLLGSLRSCKKSELTILLLGKSGAGKSSTANSLFNEKVASINPFQTDSAKPTVISRQAAGFTLHVIDTPSLLEADNVNEMSLSAIGYDLRKHSVDVVLLVDRLDVYRVEPLDKMMIEAVSRQFGPSIWSKAIIGLTHGDMRSPPPGTDFASYVAARADGIRKAIKSTGGSGELAVALIENSSRCRTNDKGEKIVGPDAVPWLPAFMKEVNNITLNGFPPFEYDGKATKNSNPNKKRRWLIPFIFAAQVAFKVLVFDVLMDEDGATGDQYGPYDPEFVEEERQRRREERKNRTAGLQAKEERRRAARSGSSRPVIEATPAPSAPSKAPAAATSAGWDDDSDDEDI